MKSACGDEGRSSGGVLAGERALSRRMAPFAALVAILVPAAVAVDPVAGTLYADWPRPLWLVAEFTTHFGEAQWILAPTALIALVAWVRNPAAALDMEAPPSKLVRICAFLFAVSGSALLLASILKSVFGRARPQLMQTVGPFSWQPGSFEAAHMSFPSGHAASIGAACMAAALLWPRLRFLFFGVAVWLALTRVFVGAHYPSDVVAGLLLGVAVTLCLAAVTERRGFLAFPEAGRPRSFGHAAAEPQP
ncbi:MAG: phosphatase PAP2 family protein [Rhizobiaceae bacterium]